MSNFDKIDVTQKNKDDINYRLKAGIFLTSVTGLSALIAFAATVASAKRKDPQMFQRGVAISKEFEETGLSLAIRALKWGTIYSVSGTSLIAYGIWKLSGATSLHDFRMRMGNILPRITKDEPPKSRTEFSGLNDLLTYLSTDYSNDVSKSES